MTHKKLLLTGFLSVASLCANNEVTPTLVARSQGLDGARKLVGVTGKVHQYDAGCYWNFSVAPEYTKSFRSKQIAHCLFGDDADDCGKILVQGSAVADRAETAWLADYFYLAPDFDSYFSVEPTIQNILVDLDLYVGLDRVVDGMYLRLHGPINWTKWNLKFEERCDQETTGSYTAGYFSTADMPNNQLLRTFASYARGDSPLDTLGSAADPKSGTEFNGLEYAKIQRCSRTKTGFADLRAELGYDFFQADDYHFGLNFQLAMPTSSKRDAQYAFDAVVGNGNHWEVGGGLTAHYVFWRGQSEDKHAGFYLDATIMHVNKAREQRTFDLANKPNSRYMLAQKMGPLTKLSDFAAANPTTPVLTAGTTSAGTLATGTAPVAEFAGVFAPVANLTSLNVDVNVGVQADIAAMFNYTSNQWSFDLGYNFWGRSCEKIRVSPKQSCCENLCSSKNQWALKGDARVYGFMAAAGAQLSSLTPVRLSATECGADIHNGTNAGADITDCAGVGPTLQNCGVDNAEFAYGNGVRLIYVPDATGDNIAANHIKTSLEPKFINCCDINFQETRGISNKVFTHLSYTWGCEYSPYLGIGGFAEFGSNGSCSDSCSDDDAAPTVECGSCVNEVSCCETSCNTDCSECVKCSLSQWGVWLKGGITFN